MLNTPYSELLPPLSTEEFEALKADIGIHGVRVPIIVDEDGNILDGHNRYAICPTAPVEVVAGLSEPEKRALVYRSNNARRNLSPEQKKELRKAQKKLAQELNAMGWTQSQIAAVIGVTQQAVGDWLNESNTTSCNTFVPVDGRQKVSKQNEQTIFDLHEQGLTNKEIAADFKVTPQRVGQIVNKQQKQQEQRKPVESSAELPISTTVLMGDFRDVLESWPSESIDMIFTDPPYDRPTIPLYGDMAKIAARILKPGGSLLAYVGHYAIGEVYNIMSAHLKYWWMIAMKHGGNSARLPGLNVFVEWKPIMWWVKDGRNTTTQVPDFIQSQPPDKLAHEWQQGIVEAKFYIEKISRPNAIILDPFCGSGTTIIAANDCGRQGIGIEIDKGRCDVAIRRIADYTRLHTA